MRTVLIALALSLVLPPLAHAAYEPVPSQKRPDTELKIHTPDIFVEMINASNPSISASLKLWRFQKLLSLINLGAQPPVWDIDLPRSLKLLEFNDNMLRELLPSTTPVYEICALCIAPK